MDVLLRIFDRFEKIMVISAKRPVLKEWAFCYHNSAGSTVS